MSKYALILGGSSGIGLATGAKLVANGFNLFVVHRDKRSNLSTLNRTLDEWRTSGAIVHSYNVDALNQSGIELVVSEISKISGSKSIDVLVHSIAKGNLKPLKHQSSNSSKTFPEGIETEIIELMQSMVAKRNQAEFSPTNLTSEDFNLTINAMAISLHNWAKSLIEHDLFSDNSSIVGLTSEGSQRVWQGYGAVAAAKSVLESLIKYMAVEYASIGIRSNLIQAGVTDTPSLNMIPGSDFLKGASVARNPFGRLTNSSDVADAIYLLTLPESKWINGSTIIVDGGEHLCS